MSFFSKTGAFNIGVGAAGTTVTVVDVGFRPKAIVFWWSGRTEATDTTGRQTHQRGIGMATSPANQYAACSQSQDAIADAVSDQGYHNANCIETLTTGGVIDGLAAIQSLNSNGFTLVINDQFSASIRVHYLALGGDDIENATVGELIRPSGTGNFIVSGLGFQPEFIMFAGPGREDDPPPSQANDSSLVIGAAVSSSRRITWTGGSNDGEATSVTRAYLYSGECLSTLHQSVPASLQFRSDFVSFNADGFTLNVLEATAFDARYFYLALRGGRYAVGTLQTQTNTTTDISVPLGFNLAGVIFLSKGTAESVQDTADDHDDWSLGAATALNQQGVQGVHDRHNVATTEVTTLVNHNNVYASFNADGSVNGLMALTVFGPGSFTARMTDADSSQMMVAYIAFGAGGVPVTPSGVVTVPSYTRCMPEPIFRLRDGTVAGVIDFLERATGIILKEWKPKIIQPKSGGTFQDSSLAAGRRLAHVVDATAIETLTLTLRGTNQNRAARALQELQRLLNVIRDYWTGVATTPVYIEAKAALENNTRYALLHQWQMEEIDDPYHQPFFSGYDKAVLEDLILVLERSHWLASVPGTSTAIPTATVEAFNSINLGNVDSTGTRSETTAGTYVGNRSINGNITHVYRFDNSAGTFSSNLMNASLPYNLYPSPAGDEDILYIGSADSVTDYAPFYNLIFDITTVAAGTHAIVWEYWSGAAWSTLSVTDNTDSGGEFRVSGIHSVHWAVRDTVAWDTTSINGVTAYWVRARIDTFTSMTIPQQGNRDIYSATWGYVEIQSSRVLGDIPAIAKIKVTNTADQNGPLFVGGASTLEAPGLYLNRVVAGLRSYDRGASFRAYITIGSTQNISGVTIASASPDTTPDTRLTRWIFTLSAASFYDGITITIDASIATHYYGTYHAFLRGKADDGTTGNGIVSFRIRVQVGSTGTITTSKAADPGDSLSTSSFLFPALMDLGQIAIAPNHTSTPDSITITIQGKTTVGGAELIELYDLVLIPVDEWAGDFVDILRTNTSVLGRVNSLARYLEIDSVSNPKVDIQSLMKRSSDDRTVGNFSSVVNGPCILQANERQRLWLLSGVYFVTTGTHTGANGAATLTDSAATFTLEGVAIGDIIVNFQDSSYGTITTFAATTVTATLVQGSDNLWDTGDRYYIITQMMLSDISAGYLVQVEATQRYLSLRGDR